MSQAIDFRLTQHNLEMSQLRRAGNSVKTLYQNHATDSELFDSPDAINRSDNFQYGVIAN